MIDPNDLYENAMMGSLNALEALDDWLKNGGKLPDAWARKAGTGTEEAMEHLKAAHPLMIAWGMHFAVKIALRKLTVHSREVRDAMAEEGLLAGGGKEFWLGAVFRELRDAGVLVKTLHSYKYSDEERGIHERTVPLWVINEKADLTPYRVAPKERP